MAALLDRILDDHGLIACGWSGEWDVALHKAIMGNPSRRYSTYWAARDPVGDAARQIITHRGAEVVPVTDADDFFRSLRDKLVTLARTQRQRPESVDLLVGTAKRFAARHEHRIEIHDLIESETQRCLRKLQTSTPQVDATAEGIEELVNFQEAAVEPLARTLGVFGRWGEGAERDSAVNAMLAVWQQAGDSISGGAIHFRHYPAVLLLWAYGLGMTIARRWSDVHGILLHPVNQPQGDPNRLVSLVSDWILEGYRNKLWSLLPGMEHRRTPESDRMLGVFNEWRGSFAAIQTDFDEQHDIWEILFALIYADPTAIEAGRDQWDFWAPIGRVGWRHQSRARILTRIQSGDLHGELISVGVAGGSGDKLVSLVEEYSKFIGGLRWR